MSELYHAAQLPLDIPSDEKPTKRQYRRLPRSKDEKPTEVRICPKCGGEMRAQWNKSRSKSGGSWKFYCRPCKVKRHKELNPHPKHSQEKYQRALERNPDLNRDYYRSRRERNPGYYSGYDQIVKNKRQFGLTREQYYAMLEAQGNVCAICGEPERAKRSKKTDETKTLAVDHDHATDKARALLCTRCNMALGLAGDSPERLRKMADYLELHKNL